MSSDAPTPDPDRPTDDAVARVRPRPWLSTRWVPIAIGVVATLVGLLPWLLAGARLPIQNLWEVDVAPEKAPLVALPFSQYTTTALFSVIVLAWVFAALTVRLLGFRLPGRAPLVVGLTIAVLQTIALVQTAAVVASGLRETDQAQVYLWGLTLGAAFSMGIGAFLYQFIATGSVPAATVALSTAAVVLPTWFNSAAWAAWGMDRIPPAWLALVTDWGAPVLVGLIVAWCGVSTVGRKAAAVASVLLLWVFPALLAAVSGALGTRVLSNDPAGMLDYFVDSFRMALGPWGPGRAWMLRAVFVALIASAALWLYRRRGSARSDA